MIVTEICQSTRAQESSFCKLPRAESETRGVCHNLQTAEQSVLGVVRTPSSMTERMPSVSVSASLTGNEIYDNTASTYSGGGIYLRNDPGANLSNNAVHGNSAKGGGGGVYLDNCDDAVLTSNNVLTNTSQSYGGGAG